MLWPTVHSTVTAAPTTASTTAMSDPPLVEEACGHKMRRRPTSTESSSFHSTSLVSSLEPSFQRNRSDHRAEAISSSSSLLRTRDVSSGSRSNQTTVRSASTTMEDADDDPTAATRMTRTKNYYSDEQQRRSTLVLLARGVCTLCALWTLTYCLVGATTTGKAFFAVVGLHNKALTTLAVLGVPLLVASTVAAAVLVPNHHRYSIGDGLHHCENNSNDDDDSVYLPRRLRHTPCGRRLCPTWLRNTLSSHGDPDFTKGGVWGIFVPCTIFLLCSIRRNLAKDESQSKTIMHVGNSFGVAALIALSILLVPVSRHGPLIDFLGWNPAAAVQLHVWAGRFVMLGVVGHGALHTMRWVVDGEDVLTMLVAPRECLHWTTPKDYDPPCRHSHTDCSCYSLVRNGTGLIGGVALVILGVSSLSIVRRNLYTLFYKIHMLAGPTMLLFTILHWYRSSLYLAGGLVYYMASGATLWWRQSGKSGTPTTNEQTTIRSIERLAGTRHACVAITVAATDAAIAQYRPGNYVQVAVSGETTIAHPFTVNTTSQPRELRIIVRCAGPFTTRLAQRLTHAMEEENEEYHTGGTNDSHKNDVASAAAEIDLPHLHLEGFYGCPDRVSQILYQHDVAVFVAGGIGITPYLSLLSEVVQALKQENNNKNGGRKFRTRTIVLHWMCRDPALIAYIQSEYLDALTTTTTTDRDVDFTLRILIHRTGPTSTDRPSYSDVEQSSREGCSTASKLVVPTSQQRGTPFAPFVHTGFIACRRGPLLRMGSFFPFAIIAWAGIAGILLCYSLLQTKHTTLSRLPGLVYVFALSYGVSRIHQWRTTNRNADDKVGGGAEWSALHAHDEESESALESSLELTATTLSARNRTHDDTVEESVNHSNHNNHTSDHSDGSNDGPTIEHVDLQGRPTVHQFLNHMDEARRPGLWVCGPTPLMNEIEAATQERCLQRCRQCIRGRESQIALYKETFEL